MVERLGFKVTKYERNFANKEKKVDVAIAHQMTKDAYSGVVRRGFPDAERRSNLSACASHRTARERSANGLFTGEFLNAFMRASASSTRVIDLIAVFNEAAETSTKLLNQEPHLISKGPGPTRLDLPVVTQQALPF
jgi:hypothetical protein